MRSCYFEDVAYGPRLYGQRNRKALDTIVEKQLRAARLWDEVKDRLHALASALSVGQQQRLCLTRGLAVEPEVLLCDEAILVLDPISARRIEERLIELKADYTIVLVTNVLRQAQRLADYVILMYLGELIEPGPVSQVLLTPSEEKTRAIWRESSTRRQREERILVNCATEWYNPRRIWRGEVA